MEWITLFYLLIGLSSALISGITGLAGGVLLLSALSTLLPIEVVIPIHALVQVLANLSRVLLLSSKIEWAIWRSFNLLTIPAGLIGAYSVQYLPQRALRFSVGAVVIFAALYTLKKTLVGKNKDQAEENKGGDHPQHQSMSVTYLTLGCISSLLGMVIGATGPLIAPFFMMDGLKRERLIATKSACQLTVQVIKTIIFLQILDFAYIDYSSEISLVVIGVFGGTWLAKRILSRVQGDWLELLISFMLVVIGCRLLLRGLGG